MYDAFISYSQRADGRIAKALRSVIQSIGKPWWKLRDLNVYVDSSSLSANPDLWGTIEQALNETRYLVLLASPEAAASRWVDKEVGWWLEHKSRDTLLIALTDGTLNWSLNANDFIWDGQTPLPPCLKSNFRTEPLWVSLVGYRAAYQKATRRNQDFLDRALSLAATIHGRKKDDLYSDELREQRRNLRWVYSAAAVLFIATIASLAASLVAIQERDTALISQSRFLADRSNQQSNSGDDINGMLVALEGLPDVKERRTRPYVAETEISLLSAFLHQKELQVLDAHAGKVYDVAIHSDTGQLVTAYEDGSARLWDLTSGKLLQALERHRGPVVHAAFRPDGRQVVTASDDGTVRLWTIPSTHPEFKSLEGQGSPIKVAKYSPDGTRVFAGDGNGQLMVWESSTGKSIATLLAHNGAITSIEFDRERQRIITSSEDHTARVWDIGQGTPVLAFSLKGHTEKVESALLSPDDRWIVTASADGRAIVWDAQTGGKQFVLGPIPTFVYRAEFSPDSERVLIVSNDGLGRVWNLKSPDKVAYVLKGHDQLVHFGTFSSDGRFIATISQDGTARLWSAFDGSVAAILHGHLDFVSTIAIDQKTNRIVTGSWDGTVRIWAAQTSKAIVLPGHKDKVYRASYSYDGSTIITASEDGSARLWQTQPLQELGSLVAKDSRITDAEFSRDGKYIVTTHDSRDAVIWDAFSRRKIRTLDGHTDVVLKATFSPDSKYVATASRDQTAKIWDVATGQPIKTLRVGTAIVNSVVFSPDGSKVVTADGSNAAIIWDWRRETEIKRILGNGATVYPLAIDPKGKRFAFSSWSFGRNIIQIRNLDTADLVASLDGHSEFIWSLSFDRTGTKLVSASKDGKAVIWDAINFREIGQLAPHSGWVYSAEFDPEGKNVLTSDAQGNIRIWPVPQTVDQLVEAAKESVPRCLTAKQRREIALLETDPPIWCRSKWPNRAMP
jgi:WD40 repeat protein